MKLSAHKILIKIESKSDAVHLGAPRRSIRIRRIRLPLFLSLSRKTRPNSIFATYFPGPPCSLEKKNKSGRPDEGIDDQARQKLEVDEEKEEDEAPRAR